MAALAVASLAACSASTPQGTSQDAGPDSGNPFGCCPDVKSGCTLVRNGPKEHANDDCILGFDGVVLNPQQPGWTHGVDKFGCGVWSPPPNAATIVCGQAPPPPERPDAGDASAGDADAAGDADTSDGGVDAPTN